MLLVGDNNFQLDQEIAKIRRTRATVLLSGEGLSEQAIVNACEEYSDVSRFIVVDDIQLMGVKKPRKNSKKPKKIAPTSEQASPLKVWVQSAQGNKQTTLILIARTNKCPAYWQDLAQETNMKVGSFLMPPWWEMEEASSKFVTQEAKTLKLKLSDAVISKLVELAGGDFYALHNELKKLSMLWHETQKEITKSDIEEMVPRSSKINGADVVDKAFSRNFVGALSGLEVMSQQNPKEYGGFVLGSLQKKLELLIAARGALETGLGHKDIASLLEMHPVRYQKSLQSTVDKYSLSSLIEHMGNISKLDRYLKSGATVMDKKLMVELTVINLAKN